MFKQVHEEIEKQRSKNRRRRAALLALLLLLLLLLWGGVAVYGHRQALQAQVSNPASGPAPASQDKPAAPAEPAKPDCLPYPVRQATCSGNICFDVAAYTDGQYIYHLVYSKPGIYYFPNFSKGSSFVNLNAAFTVSSMPDDHKMVVIRIPRQGLSYDQVMADRRKNKGVVATAVSSATFENTAAMGNKPEDAVKRAKDGAGSIPVVKDTLKGDLDAAARKLTYLPFLPEIGTNKDYFAPTRVNYIPVFPLDKTICRQGVVFIEAVKGWQ